MCNPKTMRLTVAFLFSFAISPPPSANWRTLTPALPLFLSELSADTAMSNSIVREVALSENRISRLVESRASSTALSTSVRTFLMKSFKSTSSCLHHCATIVRFWRSGQQAQAFSGLLATPLRTYGKLRSHIVGIAGLHSLHNLAHTLQLFGVVQEPDGEIFDIGIHRKHF